jgi:O-antigen ligase
MLLGVGYGTRITGATQYAAYSNAVTLDDQWLGNLLETGLVGALTWIALFWSAIKRFGSAAREDRSERGAFFAAVAASIAAFAVGMLTYDAFAFIQVTFIFWIIFALGAARLMLEQRKTEDVQPVPA